VYEAVPPAMTDERLGRLAEDLSDFLDRSMNPLELSDWADLDTAGLGEFARVYGFRTRTTQNATGDGALAVFSRGNLVSYVMMLNLDGQAATDLRQYAGMLDGRVQRDLATRAGAQPSAR
jgi:hypothetical protein